MSGLTEQFAKPTTKQSVDFSPPLGNPSIRFYYSDDLRAKTLAVLRTLEQAQDSRRHRDALSDIVLELMDSGLDYYFMRPLKLAKVGVAVEQSVHLGLVSVKRVLGPIIRNILGHMDQRQLLIVCIHIRQLMV
jgi:hypothetical protein